MRKIKSGLSLLMAVVMTLTLLSGCFKPDDSATVVGIITLPGSSSADQSTPPAQSEAITLTDQAGRTLTLEQPAQRVVSAYYLSTSLLIALGVQDAVVGLEMKADTREIYHRAAPEFLTMPAVGSGKGINVEETAALEPDLVILPMKLADSAAQFDALGIPCMVINPETMEGFLETIDLIGQAVGAEDAAQKLAALHQDGMDSVGERCAVSQNKPTVYLAGTDFLRTAGAGMYQNDLITTAGGVNVAAELDSDQWVDISPEQLVAWNPEYIFMVSYAGYTRDDIMNDPRFASLQAVQNEKVYVFPSLIEPWDYPTPSSVLGIYWLAAMLHPDIVSVDEYTAAAQDFYQTYYGLTVSNEDLMTTGMLVID